MRPKKKTKEGPRFILFQKFGKIHKTRKNTLEIRKNTIGKNTKNPGKILKIWKNTRKIWKNTGET